ncbi:hypothetical protein [Streptomyces fagopyri]|uniref:hypothetical protein n=1 Tax=Streptomyces fagopyri TaxID=2662397 RepID=UPI00382A1896
MINEPDNSAAPENEAVRAELPEVTEYAHWKSVTARRPGDVRTRPGGPVPLGWQAEKRTDHATRLMNNALPADFAYPVERGDAGDALAVLALGESMRRDLKACQGSSICTAAELGATWREIAGALDIQPQDARDLLRDWAARQHNLYQGDVKRGAARPLGLDTNRYSTVLSLCTLGDDGEQPLAMTPEPAIRCLVIRSDDRPGPEADGERDV